MYLYVNTLEFLKALLPGMQPEERLEAFLNRHPQSLEYHDLYHLMRALCTDDLQSAALARMRRATDPLQLCRLRYLLKECDRVVLTTSDIATLIETIQHGPPEDQCAALALAVAHARTQIPLAVLMPLLQQTPDDDTFIPAYASWLMCQSEAWENITYETLTSWPLQWRAMAAATRADFREQFLSEIDQALATSRGVIASPIARPNSLAAPIVVTVSEAKAGVPHIALDPQVLSPSRHGRIAESTTGGLVGSSLNMQTVFTQAAEEWNHPEATEEKFHRLQDKVRAELSGRTNDPQRHWLHHPFPQALIDDLQAYDPQRFAQWLDALLCNDEQTTAPWYGLSVAMFRTALRIGHPRTDKLWRLIFPFQRGPTGRGIRFVHAGIDGGLHDLSHPDANDAVATELLTALVCEAESDWELYGIALGARHQGQTRLCGIVTRFVHNTDATTRARALRIAGWLEGMLPLITHHAQHDPSLWVRRVGMLAHETQSLEAWARHWFSVFLDSEASPDTPWGAGQLFLTCVDSRYKIWTHPLLGRDALTSRTRGEATLRGRGGALCRRESREHTP